MVGYFRSVVINYISHLDPYTYSGGGEAISRALLEWVKSEFKAKVCVSTLNPYRINFNSKARLTVFCDLFNNPNSLRRWPPGFLSWAADRVPFIHLDNAYVDICRMGYLPCSGQAEKECSFKQELSFADKIKKFDFRDSCDANKNIFNSFYKKSKMNVFLSPLHRATIERVLNIKNHSFILKPLIDTTKFKNMNLVRDIDYLFVGVIGEAKGYQNLKKYFLNSGKKLTLAGKNITGESLEWAEYLGILPYEELPTLYNRAENFVFLPRWPEPQGRVIVEAALSGCKLITNEMCGATSFDFDISDAKNIQNVESEFWHSVIKVI
jgi:glycosyltransferase involved in cell wall biosynthesis